MIPKPLTAIQSIAWALIIILAGCFVVNFIAFEIGGF